MKMIIDPIVAQHALSLDDATRLWRWVNAHCPDERSLNAVVCVTIDDTARVVLIERQYEPGRPSDVETVTILDGDDICDLVAVEWVWLIELPPTRSRWLPSQQHHFKRHRPKEIHYHMGQITVHDDQAPFTATIVLLDKAGQPTTPDDVPVWASSADNVATVTPAADGMSAQITVVGGLGSAQVVASTTDTDGTKLVLTGDVIVTAGEAVSGEIDFTLPAPVTTPVVVPFVMKVDGEDYPTFQARLAAYNTDPANVNNQVADPGVDAWTALPVG